MARWFYQSMVATILCASGILAAHAMGINELLPEERSTVALFQAASPKVVSVHRLAKKNQHGHIVRTPAGMGSGILWDKAGHVVTNFHVIKGADSLMVSMGKRRVPVKIVGVEPRKDIAVLQIESPEVIASLASLAPFELVPTNSLFTGQKALAIGNPFGLDHTLTVGIISALGRQVPGIGGVSIHDMIQTDASINPGNSGGPLLDSKGGLIGLNTVIYSSSGSSAGIGFAIPASVLAQVVPQLITHKRVVLAGIGIQPVEPSVAQRMGVRRGIVVGKVLPGTPAAKAGLQGTSRNRQSQMQLGDIIVGLNDRGITNYDDLYNLLTSVRVGEKIRLIIDRHGKKHTITLKTVDIAAYS